MKWPSSNCMLPQAEDSGNDLQESLIATGFIPLTYLEHNDIVRLKVRLHRLPVSQLPVKVDNEAPRSLLVPFDGAPSHCGPYRRSPRDRSRTQYKRNRKKRTL